MKLAEIFEIPVSRLLNTLIENTENKVEIAEQRSLISEQLYMINRRSKKVGKAAAWFAVTVAFVLTGIFHFILPLHPS